MLRQRHLKELLSDRGRTNFARGCEQHQGSPKSPSPTRTVHMIIGSGEDASINNVKFTTTHMLKRSISRKRHADMPGILKEIFTHKLNVNPFYPLVRQVRHKFNSSINDAVREEVEKLLENGSVRESKYPQWVANVVMVKKKNRKWWMCVDFTDLNKACPKDSFSLSHIDQLIDATAVHELLSFLDAYSVYNKILVDEEDQ
uniref:RNA-directed DNA polymerase homolog n=1 Tax=Nicotiana tabacum TaxID=4097 RepID=A0A1S4CQ46_TOBAC|nr:PREDICTED: uncharacterized protein LOC107821247 [Nicotiana tabacum]